MIYGDRCLGKTRLAKEWLDDLRKAKPAWILGFLPRDADMRDEILAMLPTQPTAIVIDDARTADLDTFLPRARASWGTCGHCVRFLLLADWKIRSQQNLDQDGGSSAKRNDTDTRSSLGVPEPNASFDRRSVRPPPMLPSIALQE
jgi:hypothetical protein